MALATGQLSWLKSADGFCSSTACVFEGSSFGAIAILISLTTKFPFGEGCRGFRLIAGRGLERLEAELPLRSRRLTAQEPNKNLVDELGIILLAGGELIQLARRIGQRVGDGWPVDQLQNGPKNHAAG